jgi:hypothetical protein
MGYNEDVMQGLSYSLRNFNDYSLPTLKKSNANLEQYLKLMEESNKIQAEANELKKLELMNKGQYKKTNNNK